jgi:hypothetical protein
LAEVKTMRHKAIYFAVALGFMMLLVPRVLSQDANESNRTRETPTPRGLRRPSKVSGPAVQNAHHALGKSTRIATFEECRQNLSEFKEAQQFQRLKAVVFADLNRLDKSKRPKPDSLAARDADIYYQGTGNVMVNRANGRSISELPVQAKSTVLPVLLMPAESSKRYIIIPDNQELAGRPASNSH